ncbi:MAG: hypothetical protein HOC23_19585 [Halieaceae bacterium]|jgi:cell division septum initiation protein DivIVA|nr:hypothetical protein [Halieaceae bacterium]
MSKSILSCLFVLALVLFTAAHTQAQGKSFVKKLGISEEQATELIHIKEVRRAHRKAEGGIYLQLNLVINSADYQADTVKQLARQLANLVEANTIAESTMVNAFYVQLDDVQKQKWEEHETRNNKRLKRMGKNKGDKQGKGSPQGKQQARD